MEREGNLVGIVRLVFVWRKGGNQPTDRGFQGTRNNKWLWSKEPLFFLFFFQKKLNKQLFARNGASFCKELQLQQSCPACAALKDLKIDIDLAGWLATGEDLSV